MRNKRFGGLLHASILIAAVSLIITQSPACTSPQAWASELEPAPNPTATPARTEVGVDDSTPSVSPGPSPAPETREAPTLATYDSPADVPDQVTETPTAGASPQPSATPSASASPTDGSSSLPSATAEMAALPWEERPILVVESHGADPQRPSAGSGFSLRIDVENVGEHLAENVRLSLSASTFLPGSDGGMLFCNKIDEGESAGFETDMIVSTGAAPGVHSVTIALQWDDSYGGSYSDQATVGIEVGSGQLRPSVIVAAARLPGRVSPGIPFTLSLDLINSGGRDARDVVITLASGPLAPSGAGAAPVFLPPGGQATVDLTAIAAALPEPGAASQAIELRYEDPEGERYNDTQNVGLVITGAGATDPLLVVGEYSVDPSLLNPGDVFGLALSLVNVGATDASQVRLVLGGGASSGSVAGSSVALGPFAPLGTGNVRFLGRVRAGEETEVNQEMVVDGSAEPGVYTLGIGLQYVDCDGRERSETQQVALLVSREVEIQLRAIDAVTRTAVGEPFDFEIEVTNAGSHEVTIPSVVADPGRYMSIERGEIFVGPLGSGDLDVLDAVLTPKAPTRDAVVTVRVEYIDDFNRRQTVEEEYHFEIADEPQRSEVEERVPEAAPTNLAVRIVKGLLGLGASNPLSSGPTAIGEPALEPAADVDGGPSTDSSSSGSAIVEP